MQPTRVRDLISVQAEQEGIPIKDLTDMLTGYYDQVKDIMSTLGTLRLSIPGLGYMNLKSKLLDKSIAELEKKLYTPQKGNGRPVEMREENEIYRQMTARREDVQWERDQKEQKKEEKLYYRNKLQDNEAEGHTTGSME